MLTRLWCNAIMLHYTSIYRFPKWQRVKWKGFMEYTGYYNNGCLK